MLRGAGFFVSFTPHRGGGEREVRDVAEETPPRYCSVCHHELKPEDYLYCPKCGTALILAAEVPTPEADRAVPLPPQPDAGSPGEAISARAISARAARPRAARAAGLVAHTPYPQRGSWDHRSSCSSSSALFGRWVAVVEVDRREQEECERWQCSHRRSDRLSPLLRS